MMDDLQIVKINLYFPMALVLSEDGFMQIRHKKLLCTVEIRHFGRRGVNADKREKGIVRSLRVLFFKDSETNDWMDWPSFLPSVGITGKKLLGFVQEAITKEVIKGLGLTPIEVYSRIIVPRDLLTEAI